MKNFYLFILAIALFGFNESYAQSCPNVAVSDGTSLKFYHDPGTSLCEERPLTITVDTFDFSLIDCGDTFSTYQIMSPDSVDTENFTADFGYGICEYENNTLIGETLLSVDESEFLENSLRVFPNPVSRNSDLFVLLGSNMDVKINMYSVTGKLVFANEVSNSDRLKIDTSTLSNGVYLLQINANNTTVTRKVIVMN